MGNQLIILGCVGSYNPQLTADLVKILSERGLEIQHASNRYQGQTHFAVGTGADLAAAFDSAEIKTAFVEVIATAEPTVEPITLQTVLDAVNEGRKEAAAFFKYERKDDKKRGKKNEEGGGPKLAPEPENKTSEPPNADEKPADEGQTQETQGTTEGDTQTAKA